MYLKLSDAQTAVTIEELGVFTKFSALIPEELSEAGIQRALERSEAGELQDGHVFVSVDFLRRFADSQGQLTPEWESQLAGMLGYAQSKGWLSADGRSVQIHVEKIPSD